MPEPKTYPLHEAMKALNALRDAAGSPPEQFPLQAFVGMISDEIDALRQLGRSDDEIVAIIRSHSAIDITAEELAANYATPGQRHPEGRE